SARSRPPGLPRARESGRRAGLRRPERERGRARARHPGLGRAGDRARGAGGVRHRCALSLPVRARIAAGNPGHVHGGGAVQLRFESTSLRDGGTMNAEPAQIEGSAPAGMLPEAPAMSAPATLVGIFTKPRQTFHALEHKPRILAPLLVVMVFQIVFAFVAMQSGIQKADTLQKLEQKNAPPEQIEAVTKVMDSPARFLFILGG